MNKISVLPSFRVPHDDREDQCPSDPQIIWRVYFVWYGHGLHWNVLNDPIPKVRNIPFGDTSMAFLNGGMGPQSVIESMCN